MKKAVPLMIQGTHSDAGKSVLVTALCRIFVQDGYATAPFKSQNMSLNSYLTIDGKEIGRAQGIQAEAACAIATTNMNPILIKPTSNYQSEIVVHGKTFKQMKAGQYRREFYSEGLAIIRYAYHELAKSYDIIVIEGAGSPAEINLNDRELVNMKVAEIANAPVILVGDIDRGGVFASLVGTLQLLKPHERQRVIGVVINKFRGDIGLLEPGLTWFEQYTKLPVLGVIPYVDNLQIAAEDSVALDAYALRNDLAKEIDIAVLQYPFLANFIDFEPLLTEKDCQVRFVNQVSALGTPDILILPSGKHSLEDSAFLHKRMLMQHIRQLAEAGTTIIGIGSGFQLLGSKLIGNDDNTCDGLGLLDIVTALNDAKRPERIEGFVKFKDKKIQIKGYKILDGKISMNKRYPPFLEQNGKTDGMMTADRKIIGTNVHGLFHNDEFRKALLNEIRVNKGLAPIEDRPNVTLRQEESIEKLATVVRSHLQLEKIYDLMYEFQRKD